MWTPHRQTPSWKCKWFKKNKQNDTKTSCFLLFDTNQCSLLQHSVGVYRNVQRPIRKSVFIFRRCAAAVGVCGKSGSHLSRAVCHAGLFSERQTWLNRAVVLVVLYANACNCCHVMKGILFIANLHKHGDKKSFRRSAADLKNKPLCSSLSTYG